MSATAIPVPINAARICQAISRIGYSPVAALKDIIDNSVTAKASKIIVELHLREGKTFSNKNSVEKFVIIDNGSGMDSSGILKAFELGSSREYDRNSLSKYGLGMKSAGLSLGNRISVVSKVAGKLSNKFFLDYDLIEKYDEYKIYEEELSDVENADLDDLIMEADSGTVVTIDNCCYDDQDSMRKIVNQLTAELGVVYYGFLQDDKRPLSITVRHINTDRENVDIIAHDILFLSQAISEYDASNYDCLTPCKVLDEKIQLDGLEEPIRLKAVIFPKSKMSTYPGFSAEDRSTIRGYKVSRSNMGFFIYRNGRLIRWGDRINVGGNSHLIDKDRIGLRVRMDLTSEHDDVLHVDVSKQKISIPEELEKALRVLLRDAISSTKDAFKKCDELLRLNEDEREDGAATSLNTQDLGEEDPYAQVNTVDPEISLRRAGKLLEKTNDEKDEDEESEVSIDDEKVFKKVRYTNSVLGNRLFSVGYNSDEGTFVRVNKNHYFHFTVLSQLKPNSVYKQIIEAMMYCQGVAERFTYMNVDDIDDDKIEKVLNKLSELYSFHLDKWCELNPTLLEDAEES
jgi:hypothetical protein